MFEIPQTIFREYQPSEAHRSDRSAKDRARHRQKVKDSIHDNIVDIISEESIIGKDGDKIIKIPIRGQKEFRFVFGDNKEQGVGTGDGNVQKGQVVGKSKQGQQGQGKGPKGGAEGHEDIYETEITLAELLDYLFEELNLPNLKKTSLREIIQKSALKKDGYRKVGIPVRLDRKKTAIQRIKRKKALERHQDMMEDCEGCDGTGRTAEWDQTIGWIFDICRLCDGEGKVGRRVRFRASDQVYKHMEADPKPQSNAAIIFIIDSSGSMDTSKKFLARSFFFLLHAFIKARYDRSELVFITHDTQAQEVDENNFFHSGAGGGTIISTGLEKALTVIKNRYNPSLWNNYICYSGDGDNFEHDNSKAVKIMKELCELSSLVGYGEIKSGYSSSYESSMMKLFETELKGIDNFRKFKITNKDEIWTRLREFLSIDEKSLAA
jgi:uncharacterized protein